MACFISMIKLLKNCWISSIRILWRNYEIGDTMMLKCMLILDTGYSWIKSTASNLIGQLSQYTFYMKGHKGNA